MTVKELIDKLKDCPQDMLVTMTDYSDDIVDITRVTIDYTIVGSTPNMVILHSEEAESE